MAKQSGLGDQLFIGGLDVGADISAIGNLSTPRATLDSTGITQSANARIFGLRDGQAEFTAYFNPGPAADAAHLAFRGLPLTDVQLTYLRGLGLGSPGASMVSKQIGYDPTRADDGSFTFGVTASANAFGIDWGQQITPGKRSDTTATSPATGLDTTASLSFGWQAYLHVFSFTGTSVTVTIQDSADNATFATITGGAFTAASAIGAERIQSASATATVRRYVRVITTGTFSQATFCVVFVKNEALRAI